MDGLLMPYLLETTVERIRGTENIMEENSLESEVGRITICNASLNSAGRERKWSKLLDRLLRWRIRLLI